jgi:branched-chain amino acid aminotransferase
MIPRVRTPSVVTFLLADGHLSRREVDSSLTGASLQLPEGAYTTLRTQGRDGVVRIGEHVRRLQISAGTPDSPGETAVRLGLTEALRQTEYPESRIRVTWVPPELYFSIEPFEPLAERLYSEGVRCAVVKLRRANPQAKDTRFIAPAAGAYRALPPGIHEGLLVGEDGSILEGLSSNFFAMRGGLLHTEETRALHGVTRGIVLDVCRGLVPISLEAERLDALRELSEAFITSASRGVLPVARIDRTPVCDGRPGPVTREIMRRLQAVSESEAEHLLRT